MRNSSSLQMHPIRSSWIPLYCRHLEHVYSVSVPKKSQSPHWTGSDCTCPLRKDTAREIFAKASLECAGKESVKITGRCRAEAGIPMCPFSDAFVRGMRSFQNPNPEQALPAHRSSLSPRGLAQGAPHDTCSSWSSSASGGGDGQRSRVPDIPEQGDRARAPGTERGRLWPRAGAAARPHSGTRSSAGNARVCTVCLARLRVHRHTAGDSTERKDSLAH